LSLDIDLVLLWLPFLLLVSSRLLNGDFNLDLFVVSCWLSWINAPNIILLLPGCVPIASLPLLSTLDPEVGAHTDPKNEDGAASTHHDEHDGEVHLVHAHDFFVLTGAEG
jgi:hypothetical protein